MNNFPAMTEERRQELIELCEAVLAGHVQYGGDTNEEDIYKIALAALNASPAPVLRVQDGWKLVPIEPTEDMVIRGFESAPDEVLSDADVWEAFNAMSGCQQAAHKARLCYAAMLAAAPEAE
ncbi:hypothetical protein [Pantoea dispersa]|uniref:hypothetical protein n=1 Tax=Pantoea dispersa TaxID=59814 RepID=UPI00123A299E|nr:hypothetical protein [Pantoea dispersa]KAA8667409.1 hypothetical protein F4W08_22305 [Pantoea dispersa]